MPAGAARELKRRGDREKALRRDLDNPLQVFDGRLVVLPERLPAQYEFRARLPDPEPIFRFLLALGGDLFQRLLFQRRVPAVVGVFRQGHPEFRRLDPAARIAMVTAMGQQAIVMEALRAGAKDFVLKPFQPDRVLGALQKLLAA